MKQSLLTLILTIFPIFVYSQEISRDMLDETLDMLDEVIENKSYYDNEKQKKTDELRNSLKDIDSMNDSTVSSIYWNLYDAYNRVQSDSASHYLDLLEEMPYVRSSASAQVRLLISRAETYGVSGMYLSAIEELRKIDSKSVPREMLNQYYHICRTLYGWVSDYSMDPVISHKYSVMTQCYRDSILQTQEEGIGRNIVMADKMLIEGNSSGSLKLSLSDLSSADDSYFRYIYMNISEAYKQEGKRISQEYYLAKATIEDLKSGVKEYMALPQLANLLYEDGDIERAYNYLSCSMDDATYCHARLRAIEITSIYPIIDKSYKTRERSLRHRERLLTIFLIGLVVLLGLMLLYLRRQKRQLSEARQNLLEANANLQAWNRELSETDKIKEEYIAHFLSQCRSYLDSFQKYRRELLKLAKSKSHDELLKRLNSSELMDQEEQRFYRDFDEAFLNIHPHFVEYFNSLLVEDKRIELKRGELMTTELRIFALIRLGVTDTNSIARFLNYSVATVYNYRSRIRNNSCYDKSEFEEMVARL